MHHPRKFPFKIICCAILAATIPAAEAADKKDSAPVFCRPAAAVLDDTDGCIDNQKFIDQADDCLDKLVAEVKKNGKSLPGGFSLDGNSGQNMKFDSSKVDYTEASKDLSRMIALSSLAHLEIADYLKKINLPEDIEGATPAQLQRSLAMFPCYAETKDSLNDILSDVDDIKNSLIDAKAFTDSAASSSQQREGNQGTLDSSNPMLKTDHAKGNAAPSGKSKQDNSKVTGVEQDKAKEDAHPVKP
jgi:hypothetical protein